MRRYTLQLSQRLPFPASNRVKQAPFPGRYPTRVLLFFKGRAPYIGKPPGSCFYNRMAKAVRFVEFDRKHILMDTAHKPRIFSGLWRLYHPLATPFEVGFLASGWAFAYWFDRPAHTAKRLLYTGTPQETTCISYMIGA